MTVQTLTITTETTQAAGANFKVTTFEQTTTAFCDCCPNQANGTKEGLERQGWSMGSREQFCPDCNF